MLRLTMDTRGRRPRSVLATVWILLICAAVGSGIGLVIRAVRDDGGGGPRAIHVRPARRGPQSPAALWLFGARTVRLDPATLSDARDAGFQGFGSVLGGAGVVYLFDPGTGRVGVVDATRNRIVGETAVSMRVGARVDVTPVLAVQRGALWLVTGAGRLTRYELATGGTTDVELPTDVVSQAAAGGPPAPGATRVVADDDAVWAVYELGVTGNPPLTAVVRVAPDGTITSRAPLPATAPGEGRLEPQAVALGEGTVWIVGRAAVVGLDARTLAVRQSFAVQSQSPVELHDAAVAAGSLWSYDAQSGELLRLGVGDGRVRTRIPLTDGAPPRVAAPAQIISSSDAVWVRVRTGATTLEQHVARVDAASGEISSRFDAPPELEIGAIAASREPRS
jgi:hypothetical protein